MRCLSRLITEGTLSVMGKLGAALLILFAVAGPGCGGNNEATSQTDCHTFIETSYCPKVVTCFMGQTDQSGCVTTAQMGLDCSKVIGENADPKTCMDDISNTACTDFTVNGTTIVLPASCHGLFQLSGP
jgi:hypothetical protein